MQNFFLEKDIEEIITNIQPVAQEFGGKTILITGGLGFLGKYFLEVFSRLNEKTLKQPCKLIIVDNFITSHKKTLSSTQRPNVHFLEKSVIDPIDIQEPVHFIIHAAGIASPYYYREYPLETLDVAIKGTRHMLELAKKNQARLLYFSSSEIYGDPDPKHVPTLESYRGYVSCTGPRACYDESKRLGETLCRVYHEKFGVNSVVVRPFNIYGPGMMETDYRVLPNFAACIMKGKPINVYGTGNQTRTFCYITDGLTGFLLALLKGARGEPYNIGNASPEISILGLAQQIEKVLDRKLDFHVIEHPDTYPADEPIRRCPDIRKANYQLNYHPQVTLEDGLARFFKWAERQYSA